MVPFDKKGKRKERWKADATAITVCDDNGCNTIGEPWEGHSREWQPSFLITSRETCRLRGWNVMWRHGADTCSRAMESEAADMEW